MIKKPAFDPPNVAPYVLASFPYDKSGAPITVFNSYEDVFDHDNLKKSECPVAVSVMTQSCATPLASLYSVFSAGKLTTISNIPAGYSERFCLKCTVTPYDTS